MKDKLSSSLAELTFFRGRVALYAILKAFDIGRGDEVATQAFTCLAVPEAIIATGAKPVYIDLEEDGVNMSADDLEKKLNSRLKVVIIQHTYGVPAGMHKILSIVQETHIPAIEDCCHTFDSIFQNRTVGTFGSASFYSFEWGKPVVIGIGGAAIINDSALEQKVRCLYENLREPNQIRVWRLKFQYFVFKNIYRPTLYWPVRSLFHFLARYGLAEGNYHAVNEGQLSGDFSLRMSSDHRNMLKQKLRLLSQTSAYRKEIAALYRQKIASSAVDHIPLSKDANAVYVRYPLVAKNKKNILDEAKKQKIEVSGWYATPIHPLKEKEWDKVFYQKGSCPHAEELCNKIVTLPVHEKVSYSYVKRTIDFLNQL